VFISVLQQEIEEHQLVDLQRAFTDVDERLAYEQLALLQISTENPSATLTQFLDDIAPVESGARHALPNSPIKTVNDLDSMRYNGGDPMLPTIVRRNTAEPLPDRLNESKARLQRLEQQSVCKHFRSTIPTEYADVSFPSLPDVDTNRLTSCSEARYSNVDTLFEAVQHHLDETREQSFELERVGLKLDNLRASGKATEGNVTTLHNALVGHLMTHRKHDRLIIEVRVRRGVSVPWYSFGSSSQFVGRKAWWHQVPFPLSSKIICLSTD
jgi:hypothetical protein